MHVLFFSDGPCRELELVVHDPDATVAHLVDALAPGRSDLTLEAAGRRLRPGRRLLGCGITDASPVRLVPRHGDPEAPPVGAARPPLPGLRLDVVGGLDAGHRCSLREGTWALGRVSGDHCPAIDTISLASPTVSAHHADLTVAAGQVTLHDRRSVNGTWVGDAAVTAPVVLRPDEVARLGAVQVSVRLDDLHRRDRHRGPVQAASGAATVPFNRPPRQDAVLAPDDIQPPTEPEAPTGMPVVGLVAVVAPLLFGAVMVKVFGNLVFGLFALLGPVMMIGSAVEGRRRGRRMRRRGMRRFEAELQAFRALLGERSSAERLRLDAALPDPAEVLRRAETPSTRLWERRPGHRDTLRLRAGLGPVEWDPPVSGSARQWATAVRQAVAAASVLPQAPVEVDLSAGGVVGIVGPRTAALAAARSLVLQAATHHGPADLPVAVVTRPGREPVWDWAKWLPNVIDTSGRRLLAATDPEVDALLQGLLDRPGDAGDRPAGHDGRPVAGPTTLLVVDDQSRTEGRRSPARSLLRGLAGPVAGIVIARSEEHLPASCTTVIELLDDDGGALVHRRGGGATVPDVLVSGISDETARRGARALARFDDPECSGSGGGLPVTVGLTALLGPDALTPESVVAGWKRGGDDPAPVTPLGICDDGVLEIDLERDGPHALVAGTTGAGKSELLRTLVAGLAAGCAPDHLTFLLVDFKGGSAFDRCAALPHTVGLITDLDQHLAERAVRCLEAELRHRERVLRASGSSDLRSHRRRPSADPLPRLVVVIDEFATLRSELPDFVDALVSVAQRGRSLGVHLILATQRPAGAVSEHIRANTNLRIALRVQDAGDSNDVLDRPDAVRIGRDVPGRALVRTGPGDVVELQTALATATTGSARPAVEVRPFRFGAGRPVHADTASDGPSDLDRLVEAVAAAHASTGRPAPRRPWPDPLAPDCVTLEAVMAAGARKEPQAAAACTPPISSSTGNGVDRVPDSPDGTVWFAMADDPDRQRQYPVGWHPSAGPLILVGMAGTGTSTAVRSIAVSSASTASPEDLHIHVLDLGGALGPLRDLPHTGAVIGIGERERQLRLVEHLLDEMARRRSYGTAPPPPPVATTSLPADRSVPVPASSWPHMLVLVDGMGPLRNAWGAVHDHLVEDLVRVAVEGGDVGIHMVLTADRAGALPRNLMASTDQRLVFRLADDLEGGALGASRDVLSSMPVGGAVHTRSGAVVQVARPRHGVERAVRDIATRRSPPRRAPVTVGTLPSCVAADRLPSATIDEQRWTLPLGIGYRRLTPVGLELHDGEHAMVIGPSRSGRTTTLVTLVTVVQRSLPDVVVVAVAGRRSALAGVPGVSTFDPADSGGAVAMIEEAAHRPSLLLVDDADRVDDADGRLAGLLGAGRPAVRVVAAGRPEPLRSLYSHWTRLVRSAAVGLLLQPDVDLDGELLRTRLPRRSPVELSVGRGYLVGGGAVDLVQVAVPADR